MPELFDTITNIVLTLLITVAVLGSAWFFARRWSAQARERWEAERRDRDA